MIDPKELDLARSVEVEAMHNALRIVCEFYANNVVSTGPSIETLLNAERGRNLLDRLWEDERSTVLPHVP